MRALAPVLVLATVAVLSTGVALLVLGPDQGRGIVLGLHKATFIVWLAVFGLHFLWYLKRLPGLVLARRDALRRVGLVTASVAAGAVLAGGTYSLAGPWLHHHHEPDGDEHGTALTSAS
jgi:hypothetical protein